jgi:hypothetical protein
LRLLMLGISTNLMRVNAFSVNADNLKVVLLARRRLMRRR